MKDLRSFRFLAPVCALALISAPGLVGAPQQEDTSAHGQDGRVTARVSSDEAAAKPDKNVRKAQRKLADLGYYDGEIDGLRGEETVEAIRDFQEAEEVEVNGELDDATSEKLMAAKASGENKQSTARAKSSQSEEEPKPDKQVRQAQRKLAKLGYYNGEIDGLLGEQTVEAIREFQQAEDLEVTGRLDDNTRETVMDIEVTTDTEKSYPVDDNIDEGPVEEAAEATEAGVRKGGEVTGTTVRKGGKATKKAGDPVEGALDKAGGGVEEAFEATGDGLEGAIEGVGTGLKKAGGAVKDAFDKDNPDTYVTARTEYDTRQTVAQTRRVQLRLTELGYYDGQIDGTMGDETEQAIRDFQSAKGIEVTGQLDDTTVDKMSVDLDIE